MGRIIRSFRKLFTGRSTGAPPRGERPLIDLSFSSRSRRAMEWSRYHIRGLH